MRFRDRFFVIYAGVKAGWLLGTILRVGGLKKSDVTQAFDSGKGLVLMFGATQLISIVVGVLVAHFVFHKTKAYYGTIEGARTQVLIQMYCIGLCGFLGAWPGLNMGSKPLVVLGVIAGCIAAPFCAHAYNNHLKKTLRSSLSRRNNGVEY